MEAEPAVNIKDDFEYLISFLPQNWREMAIQTRAVKRFRSFGDAVVLLRVMMMHLAEGFSLKETSVWAKLSGVANVSSVAIMERLRQSPEWFRQLSLGVMSRWFVGAPGPLLKETRLVRFVDATRVKEKGPSGTTWNMHYSLCLNTLRCDEFHVTDRRGGETLKRFNIKNGDIIVGDRGYGVRPGIVHVIRHGGDVIVRINLTNLPLLDKDGALFGLLKRLRELKGVAIGDWDVDFLYEHQRFHGRVCAARKSPQAIRRAKARVLRRGQKNGEAVSRETIEASEFIMVFTTLPREKYKAEVVLEIYRGRWQIELVFKRLKSLMEFGHLPKVDERSVLGWIQGKLLIAFLIEALTAKGEVFFPWGYPLPITSQ